MVRGVISPHDITNKSRKINQFASVIFRPLLAPRASKDARNDSAKSMARKASGELICVGPALLRRDEIPGLKDSLNLPARTEVQTPRFA